MSLYELKEKIGTDGKIGDASLKSLSTRDDMVAQCGGFESAAKTTQFYFSSRVRTLRSPIFRAYRSQLEELFQTGLTTLQSEHYEEASKIRKDIGTIETGIKTDRNETKKAMGKLERQYNSRLSEIGTEIATYQSELNKAQDALEMGLASLDLSDETEKYVSDMLRNIKNAARTEHVPESHSSLYSDSSFKAALAKLEKKEYLFSEYSNVSDRLNPLLNGKVDEERSMEVEKATIIGGLENKHKEFVEKSNDKKRELETELQISERTYSAKMRILISEERELSSDLRRRVNEFYEKSDITNYLRKRATRKAEEDQARAEKE